MNRQIGRLFLLFIVLFAVLVTFTSRWTVFEAKSLQDKTANRRPLLEAQRIPRGLILADDGTRLAINHHTGHGETLRYFRSYPAGGLFSHAVGYAFISRGSSGLEKSYNRELTGRQDEFKSLIDQFSGGTKEGDDIHTTLDPRGQRAALAALGGQRGSIVALDPHSGAIKVMASIPDYNPNDIPARYAQLNRDPTSPIFNRATQARYPPGSTFKVVTAAAAIDSGKYTPNSFISGRNGKLISGVPLQNDGGADYGTITLTDALTHSVNTVFGEVGEKLGKDTMYKYMRRFGFNSKLGLDYPSDQITASGVFKGQTLLGPSDSVDIGRVAIGQERLQVTPLQMAMVAAAVANGGKLMEPRLVDRVTAPDGGVRSRNRPTERATVMSRQAASQLAAMMSKVVEEGTGTAAALQGIQVAGKTGTAEVVNGATNQAWFIAFAPVRDPRIAIAATVERTSGQGGTVAAPIAKRVMEVLLGG
ncbi:MAG: penicillin-binding protein [Thermoleophilaceae bacterium]|nr:penicillin-binding protein [Thermoleophilaceae bacterium]MEA2350117.1 penicillin-binding protein [Thermoleophilaceae bacterium]MEA2353602.1 penicillin-binding protein [Thermoleophilaceae bacterium]MEA2368999.1 penicillin-binding protein [Thermoleophilaceae bacterium]